MTMGMIAVVYGPMFAGKTTYLISRINQWVQENKKVLVVKPRIDDRYGKDKALHSHNGLKVGVDWAIDLNEIKDLPNRIRDPIDWLVIDEAMFFPADIVHTVRQTTRRGINVLLAGLDLDYKRENFGSMEQLTKMAQEKVKLQAKCVDCGNSASYTRRSIGGQQQVVGAADIYQPVCKVHHTIPFNFPYLRKKREVSGLTRIEVMADSMRVGKTTAVKVLSTGLRDLGHTVTESYEDWQNNPYLKGSYSDPAKNFLESQKWFARRKWEQIRGGARLRQGSGEVNIFLQDVAPEMDYCYAVTNYRLGRMSEEHFLEYDTYFRGLDWHRAPAPDVLVYLKVGDAQLIERASENRREFETVDTDYFLTMKRVNREWLKGAKRAGYTMNEIDTDNLNFATDQYAQEKLTQIVLESISN